MVSLFVVPERYRAVQREAEELADRVEPLAAEADAAESVYPGVRSALVESGLCSLTVPGPFGGRFDAVDPVAVCLAREAFMPVSAHLDALFSLQGIGSYAISVGGTGRQREEWLPRIGRGEALAAISAVSRVTVVSRERHSDVGTRLVLEGSILAAREPVGAPAGTVIAVENLFYNVPARLKFLKSVTTEKRLIDEFVTRYALAYPAIRFRLSHDGRVTFQTTGSGATADVLLVAYGPDTTRQLIEVGNDTKNPTGITVRGFVSDPALSWAGRTHIQLFVNGRTIRDTRLTFAVVQAYHTLLPVGRFPLALLFIEMPPEEVDVNVHPTKVEVRFRDEGAVFGAVQREVRAALTGSAPARGLGGWPAASSPGGWGAFRGHDESGELPSTQLDIPWQLQGPERDIAPGEPGSTGAAIVPRGEEGRLPIMRVIGQVGAAYIIAEGPDGLYLIDQHAAHERILYEQFLEQRKNQRVASQGLVAAATAFLSPSQAHLVEEQLPLLASIGFEIEPFGPNAFRMRAVPAILSRVDPVAALAAVVSDLENESTPLQSQMEALVIKRVCKTSAVKAGQTLSREEMEGMIMQLEACEVPHTCPHGRPTLIHLSAAQLARQFGRT